MSLKHGITLRGDSLYCPLPLSIEPYWWCEPNCPHCYFRGLNHIWGSDLRPLDLTELERKLVNGLKNKNPQSPLAYCLSKKKTIRLGNKSDPFQPCEERYQCSTGAIEILTRLDWSFVVQTRFPSRMWKMAHKDLLGANLKQLCVILPIISPGMEFDWEILERKQTEPIPERLSIISKILAHKVPLGVQGEPFIPGFHTIAMFEETLRRLKDIGVKRYNTYNFHFTPYVAKNLVQIPEIDIEKIWKYNQDNEWRKLLPKLLFLGDKYDMIIGCPDFVNSGCNHIEKANTCCGIDVPNPCTFNTHYFKKWAQQGKSLDEILAKTYDGSGVYEEGISIITGGTCEMYTLRDAGCPIIPNHPIKKTGSSGQGGFGL